MADQALAVLVDFENMARPGAKSRGDFDIQLVGLAIDLQFHAASRRS